MWDLVAIFTIALVGGAVPLLVRWTDRSLHAALALSTGLFLGAVFLHLLPTLTPVVDSHAGHDHGAHDHGGHAHHGQSLPWLFVLLGALGVYLFEALFLRTHDHDDKHRHRAVSMAAMAGLSVHAFTAGISYGLVRNGADGGQSLLVAVLAHKGFETFSLANVFWLAGLGRKAIFWLVFAFACVTPVGSLLGHALADSMGQGSFTLLHAVAAGTFLFVCMGELLPEVFHHREDSSIKVGLLAVGVALMWFLHGPGV